MKTQRLISNLLLFTLVFALQTIASVNAKPLTNNNEHWLLEDLNVLAADQMEGRHVGSKGSLHAREYIIEKLTQHNIMPFNHDYSHDFTFYYKGKLVTGTNIIAYIPAKSKSSQYIVITAHYDHIGRSGTSIYNGADDNASGTSALLYLARYLNDISLNRHIIFVFTDAEEQKFQGTKAFISSFPNVIKNTLLNINIDMIASSKNINHLFMLHRNLDKEVSKYLRNHHQNQLKVINGFKRSRFQEDKNIPWLKASDHFMFHRQHIPIIYYGTGMHKHYHSANDTATTINKQLFLNAARTIKHHVLYLANREE